MKDLTRLLVPGGKLQYAAGRQMTFRQFNVFNQN